MRRDNGFISRGDSYTVDRALIPWIGCRPVDVKDLVLAVVKQAVEDFLTKKKDN